MKKHIFYTLLLLVTSCSSEMYSYHENQSIYITSGANHNARNLVYELSQSLRSDGVTVTNNIDEADIVISLSNIKKSTFSDINKELANYNNIFFKAKYSANLTIKKKGGKNVDKLVETSYPTIILQNQNSFTSENDPQLFNELEHDIINIIKNKIFFVN